MDWQWWLAVGAAVFVVVSVAWAANAGAKGGSRTANLTRADIDGIGRIVAQSWPSETDFKNMRSSLTELQRVADQTETSVEGMIDKAKELDRATRTESYWTGFVGVLVGAAAGYALGLSLDRSWTDRIDFKKTLDTETWPIDGNEAFSGAIVLVAAGFITWLVTLIMHRYVEAYWAPRDKRPDGVGQRIGASLRALGSACCWGLSDRVKKAKQPLAKERLRRAVRIWIEHEGTLPFDCEELISVEVQGENALGPKVRKDIRVKLTASEDVG